MDEESVGLLRKECTEKARARRCVVEDEDLTTVVQYGGVKDMTWNRMRTLFL